MVTKISETVVCNAASLWIQVLFAITFPRLLFYNVVKPFCGNTAHSVLTLFVLCRVILPRELHPLEVSPFITLHSLHR